MVTWRGENTLTGIKILVWSLTGVAMLLTAEAQAQWGWPTQSPQAQAQPSPPVTSRGENFSAKPAAQLFVSDCTGAGCHKGPQGLSKDRSAGSLAGFLREHYTNSRESAAALAAYLVSARAPPRAAARSEDAAKPPDATRKPAPAGDAVDPTKPAPAGKPPRGRQATVATPPSAPAAAPAAAPEPAASPPPPAPPPEPPKPQWDIFD
jgi:hypothetical protein